MDGSTGDIDVQSETNPSGTKGLSEVDLFNSEPGEDGGNEQEQEQQQTESTHQLEFFEEGDEQHSGGGSSEGSPEQIARGKDSDSAHAAFVTLSPPLSPGKYA